MRRVIFTSRPLRRRVTMVGPTPDSWTWIGFRCPTCETTRLVRPVPHGDGGQWECWICGYPAGYWFDGGTIDLGLVTDEKLKAANDFQVFP